MARFDIYHDPDGYGYLIDVQSDLLDGLNSRVIVPLMPPETAPTPGRGLNPRIDVAGREYLMVTQYLSSVPASLLKTPVGNLSAHQDEVTRALDFLFQGF